MTASTLALACEWGGARQVLHDRGVPPDRHIAIDHPRVLLSQQANPPLQR